MKIVLEEHIRFKGSTDHNNENRILEEHILFKGSFLGFRVDILFVFSLGTRFWTIAANIRYCKGKLLLIFRPLHEGCRLRVSAISRVED